MENNLIIEDLIEKGPGIFYSKKIFPIVNSEVINFLKIEAYKNNTKRARFCAHSDKKELQHDMLIVTLNGTYITPHRHYKKNETFTIIEGIVLVLIFDEDGKLEAKIKMGNFLSGLPFFYRMPPGKFHSLYIESDLLVFIESTLGPFDIEDREHAKWAPHHQANELGSNYIKSLL